MYDLTYAQLFRAQALEFGDFILYITTITLLKTSILCFIRRLTPNMSRLMIYIINFALVINLFTFITGFVAVFAGCNPPAASWNLSVRISGATCANMAQIITGISVAYSALDFFILLIPMPIVWSLRTSTRDRLGILFFFALGGFASAASITKIVYIDGVYDSWDPTCKLDSSRP
jgi:hypothetical protein